MADLNPARKPPPAVLRIIVLLLQGVLLSGSYGGMFALGWWLADSRSAGQPPVEVTTARPITAEQQKVLKLQQQLHSSPDDPDLLLELVSTQLKQGNLQAAYDRLQNLGRRYPQRWQLGLLSAELLRASGELAAADQQVASLLAVDPHNISLLQLYCRILLERGEAAQAEAIAEAAWQRVQKSPNPAVQGVAAVDIHVDEVPYGLLLADVRRSRGNVNGADQLLGQMIGRFPREAIDPRPLIAQAMLRQDKGDLEAAQQLLAEARQHSDPPITEWLDILSRKWSLELTRSSPQAPGNLPGLNTP